MIEMYLLEQLAAFKKYGTLLAASRALHLTQPTLTRSMQKLEQEFGVPLFTHEKKRLMLNENGLLAVSFAETILRTEEQMRAQVQAKERSKNTILLGSCAPGPVMECIPRLTSLYPEMTIASEIRPEEVLLSGLYEKVYQIIMLDHVLEEDAVFCKLYGTEHLYLHVPKGHPKAKQKGVLFSEMNGESFLMSSEVGIWDQIVRTQMPDSKFLLQSGVDSLAEVAQSSSLSSFATDITLRIFKDRGDRIAIPFADEIAHASYYCICLKENRARFDEWYRGI